MIIERYTEPRAIIDDLIADGVRPFSEDLIAALLDDEINEITHQAIQIARAEY